MKDHKILVTGGGTGLGKDMSEAFLALGAEVVICGRRRGILENAARELMDRHGGVVTPIVCDIRSPEAIAEMVAAAWQAGPLTGLVNNAAGNFASRTQDLSAKGFDAIANIVFRGSFLTTREIGHRWITEKRKGNVLSVLASWICSGAPFTVPAAMSKAGLDMMTRSLAVEWASYGIRLNAICPGPFPTPGAWARLYPGQDPAAVTAAHAATNPMRRVGEAHELCNLAILLMGPGAEFVNGETIIIDGGGFLSLGRSDPRAGWDDAQWQVARAARRQPADED